MIYAISYWQAELRRLASRLRKHQAQSRWSSASDASVERCVMMGFYAIRKILQSFSPPTIAKNPPVVTVATFPRRAPPAGSRRQPKIPAARCTACGRPLRSKQVRTPEIFWPEVLEDFDLSVSSNESLKLESACNQIIHSHYFSTWVDPTNRLQGLFACSDWSQHSKIYRFDLATILEVFDQVASSRHGPVFQFGPDHNRVQG